MNISTTVSSHGIHPKLYDIIETVVREVDGDPQHDRNGDIEARRYRVPHDVYRDLVVFIGKEMVTVTLGQEESAEPFITYDRTGTEWTVTGYAGRGGNGGIGQNVQADRFQRKLASLLSDRGYLGNGEQLDFDDVLVNGAAPRNQQEE